MSRIVTQTSDPTLWGKLNDKRTETDTPEWVTDAGVHWYVIFTTSNEVEFHERETMEMLDSRSLSKSKASTYSDIE